MAASDTTFFTTVAQIIPVLWLALAIDKFGQAPDAGAPTRAVLVALSAMSAVAEGICVVAFVVPLANVALAKGFVATVTIALAWTLMVWTVEPILTGKASRLVRWTWTAAGSVTLVIVFVVLIPIK